MGVGSRQTLTATLPPGQFHCLLDELPLHLVPRGQLELQCGRQDDSRQPLFFNPQCSVLPAGQAPAELMLTDSDPRPDVLQNFYLQGPVAWVRDAATNSLQPYWLGPRLEEILSSLLQGGPAPASLPADDRLLLAIAGILVPEGHAERRRAEWASVVEKSVPDFRTIRVRGAAQSDSPVPHRCLAALLPPCDPAGVDSTGGLPEPAALYRSQ